MLWWRIALPNFDAKEKLCGFLEINEGDGSGWKNFADDRGLFGNVPQNLKNNRS